MPEHENKTEKDKEKAQEKEWRLAANTQYHEAMKIVVNLATASLVLPTVLIKDFFPKGHLNHWAYTAWILLFLSILFCMLFFYTSAKYVKVVSGGRDSPPWPLGSVYDLFKPKGKRTDEEEQERSKKIFETVRDVVIASSVMCFMVGLVCLGRFAVTLM
jgi:hypothetical protein